MTVVWSDGEILRKRWNEHSYRQLSPPTIIEPATAEPDFSALFS